MKTYKWKDYIGREHKEEVDFMLPNALYSQCGVIETDAGNVYILRSYGTNVMEYHVRHKEMYYNEYALYSLTTQRHVAKFVDYINARFGTHFRSAGAFKTELSCSQWIIVKYDKPTTAYHSFTESCYRN